MRRRLSLTMAVLVALTVVIVPGRADAGAALVVVGGDGIRAEVTPDPWRLRILDADGTELLGETAGAGLLGGLSYSFGLHRSWMIPLLETGVSIDFDAVTFRATRVERTEAVPDGIRLTVGSTEPGRRKFIVTITASAPRRLHFDVALSSTSGPLSRVRAAFRSPPGEHFSGFGAHLFPEVDQRGRSITIGASRTFRTPELGGLGLPMPDYSSVPWFVSSRGYAVAVWNHGSGVSFDLASRGEVVTWSVPVASGALSFDVYAGDPRTVLADYTAQVGRPMLLPEWSYGVWRGADRYDDAAMALGDRERFRELGLPLDVLVIDSPWETHYNSWAPNPGQWGDFDAFLATLNDGGVKPVVWITGWQNVDSTDGDVLDDPQSAAWAAEKSPAYVDFERRGLLVSRPDGRPHLFDWWMGRGASVDFSTEAGRSAWRDLATPTLRRGIHGVKTDGMEGFYFDDTVRFGDGTTGAQSAWRNLLGYRSATIDALATAHGSDWTLMGRSATHGAQSLAATWPGDQWSTMAGLREIVGAGISGGMSGFSNYLHDVGGYFGRPPTGAELLAKLLRPEGPPSIRDLLFGYPPKAEVLVRWAQVGAVTPGFLYFSKAFAQPWTYDAATFAAVKAAMVQHEQLVPYLHGAARVAHEGGLPIWRPLALVWPEVDRAWTAADEWMVGDDLLMAPVLAEGSRSRPVWLPPGEWIDAATSAIVAGDQEVVVEAPLDRLPMFIRAGAVVAAYPADVTTLSDSPADPRAVPPGGRLDVTVWPGGSGGRSTVLGSGATLTAETEGLSWTDGAASSMLVTLPAVTRPGSVSAGGVPLVEDDCSRVRDTRAGWCHDPATATVLAGAPGEAGDVAMQ